jgi:hypothetical protein
MKIHEKDKGLLRKMRVGWKYNIFKKLVALNVCIVGCKI